MESQNTWSKKERCSPFSESDRKCHLLHLRGDVVNGAVGRDGQPVLGVFDRVPPLLPILYSQRQAWILHSSQYIHKRSLTTGGGGEASMLERIPSKMQAKTATSRHLTRYLQRDSPHHVWVCVAQRSHRHSSGAKSRECSE